MQPPHDMRPSDELLHVPDAAPLLMHHLAVTGSRTTDSAVLFVHPAGRDSTVWSEPTGGDHPSWFEVAAGAGSDAWATDLRGFGGSVWGPDGAPSDPHECTRADQAVYAIDTVADHILTAHPPVGGGLHVVGWGWGGLVAALFASETDLSIASLTVLAPRLGEPNTDPQAVADWTRPLTSVAPPPGPALDLDDVFSGQPVFDPSEIACPTLLVRAIDDAGSTDSDTALLFLRLGTENKQLWEIPGDHFFVTGADGAQIAARVIDWQHSIDKALIEAAAD